KFFGVTLGWLVDSLPSGRIPAPGRVTAMQVSTQTLNLALLRALVPTTDACHRLPHTERVVLQLFQKVTVVSGLTRITYVPHDGARSSPIIVQPGWTVVAATGAFPVEIQPLRQPARICGV